MKIGCITLIPYEFGFLGLQCAKGRGLILPGGTFEPEKDATFQDAAIREAREEVGVTPHNLEYIWHGPDGFEHTTFAFLANWYSGTPVASREGMFACVDWYDLFQSKFGAYYRILHEVMKSRWPGFS